MNLQMKLFLNLSLDHYEEVKNDDIRYRGAFRQAVLQGLNTC